MKTNEIKSNMINDYTVINAGDTIRICKSKHLVIIKEIYYNQRNYDEEYGEHYTTMMKVDILNKNKKLLAVDSIVTIDAIRSGNVDRYIPNLKYDPTYLGNVDPYRYETEYIIWKDMKNRCYNYKNPEFPYIGALGTTLCDRWKCLEYFISDFKHIYGYNEDVYFRSYIVDLYDIQKRIHPSIRVYAPGYVKLKPYRESDIYKYRSVSYNYNIKYPKDLDIAMRYKTNQISINQYLFSKQTGIDVKLDLDNAYYYYDHNIGYQKPMVYYVDNSYINNQQPLKEMCAIIEKR